MSTEEYKKFIEKVLLIEKKVIYATRDSKDSLYKQGYKEGQLDLINHIGIAMINREEQKNSKSRRFKSTYSSGRI